MRAHYLLSLLVVLSLLGCQAETPTPTEIAVTVGATAVEGLVAEQTSAPATATDAPTATPRVKPQRVIVVSVPNAGEMASLGGAAQIPMQSTDPATMAVAHNALAAGQWPAEIGIVGERIHRPEDGIYWYTSAFELPMVGAKPIWKVASEQGLVTAALFWAGGTPLMPEQMADYTVGYGQRDAYSAEHVVGLYAAGSWENAPTSYSAMQEGVFQIKGNDGVIAAGYVLGIDGSDDGVAAADTFVVSRDRVVGADDASMRVGEWARWMLDAERGQGVDFLVTGAEAGLVRLFQSRVTSVLAAPEEMKREIIARWGYFAPEPDWYGLNAGWITADQYMEMVRRQSDWMMDVTLWVDAEYQPDLLMTVQSPMQQAGHQFMLVDARQVGYSEERAEEYRSYMAQADAQVDQVLGRLVEVRDDTTAVLVVSPVRLEPIHTRVNLNIALAEAGLLRLGNRGFVIMPATKAIAFSSGGAAHIYINAVGREEEGIVAAEDVGAVADEIVALLRGMVDPQSGEAIFAEVVRQNEIESGTYAGDVYVRANAGYAIDDARDADAVFEAVSFYGQEGFASEGWLSVIGWDVRGDVRIVDIAPSIAWLLGFDVSDSDGVSIFGD